MQPRPRAYPRERGYEATVPREASTQAERWADFPTHDRLSVLEEPWAELRIDNPEGRQALAKIIRHREIDVVFVAPVTTPGMVEAGTLQDVGAFTARVSQVAGSACRQATFVLIPRGQGRSGLGCPGGRRGYAPARHREEPRPHQGAHPESSMVVTEKGR